MWILLAFVSACFLGLYDVAKKRSLLNNAVVPVLLLNTFFSTVIFLPLIVLSYNGNIDTNSLLYVISYDKGMHTSIFVKSVLVLLSWWFAYFGLKHLPITIVGPINAFRPVLVLLGALTFFGERLSIFQWIGVVLAIVSFYLLSLNGAKEGINFKSNKWIIFVIFANVVGAFCGLYDKYLLSSPEVGGIKIPAVTLLAWYNVYQFLLMSLVFVGFWWPKYYKKMSFKWSWWILLISIFLSCAEIAYFCSLGLDGAMISIVSMIRRSSVVVSFVIGAWMFKEKNIKNKAVDLFLILVSMIFLCIGN